MIWYIIYIDFDNSRGITIEIYKIENLPMNVTVVKIIMEICDSLQKTLYGPHDILPIMTSESTNPIYNTSYILTNEKIHSQDKNLYLKITLITFDSRAKKDTLRKVGYTMKP